MKKYFLPIMLASFGLGLAACGNPAPSGPSEPTLSSINVTGYQTTYVIDEAFNPEMTVTATYSDASTKTIESGYTYDDSRFDSSKAGDCVIKVTYQGVSKEFTVTVIEESDPVVDLTITVTVSGISEYSGKHAYIWLSSTLKDPAWGKDRLTQDTSDPNKWSITLQEVTALQNYSYNFFYGSESEPTWTGGKNINPDGVENRTLSVSKTTTSFTDEATFEVPQSSKTFTFKITPMLQTSESATPVPISSYVYLWAWSNNSSSTFLLTNNGDGTWNHDLEVEFGSDGNGYAQFTFVLGNRSDSAPGDWEPYKAGEWKNGTFDNWGNVGRTFTLTADSANPYEYIAIFANEPEEYVVNYSITFNITFTSINFEGGQVITKADEWVTSGGTWETPNLAATSDPLVYTTTISAANAEFYFGVGFWGGTAGAARVVKDTSTWAGWKITVSAETAVVNISVPAALVPDTNAATITSVTGCTVE